MPLHHKEENHLFQIIMMASYQTNEVRGLRTYYPGPQIAKQFNDKKSPQNMLKDIINE